MPILRLKPPDGQPVPLLDHLGNFGFQLARQINGNENAALHALMIARPIMSLNWHPRSRLPAFGGNLPRQNRKRIFEDYFSLIYKGSRSDIIDFSQ